MSEGRRVRTFAGFAALVALAALTLASAGSSSITPLAVQPLSPPPAVDFTPAYEGGNLWFVELKSPPAAKGTAKSKLKAEKQAFAEAAAEAGVAYSERYSFETLWNGVSIQADASELATLSRLDGVKAVYPVVTVSIPTTETAVPELATALAQTGANVAQAAGWSGEGIKVAVMDTGIDYDHSDLGGDGVNRTNSKVFPTARVVAGWDFVGDKFRADEDSPLYSPKPQPDPYPDDCQGHGTHVSGIVGASAAAAGGATGVAPDVTFGAYRVFGCDGSTTADIMIAAMERALADGNDVLNMSIGSAFNTWDQYPTAAASNNLVDAGMVVVTSIGNSGASGVGSASAPGVGRKVIGTASFDNTHVFLKTIEVSPAGVIAGYTNAAAAPPAPTSGSLPLAKTGTPTTANDGCNAVAPAPGSLTGKAVLIRRGTCGFYEKSRNAQLAGAAAVLLYNNAVGRINPTVAVAADAGPPQDPIVIPVVAISDTEGVAINNAIESGAQTLNWTNTDASFPGATGNLISSFSSYGLGAELDVKPDIGAPGGQIRSTYPLQKGGYLVNSGTSMASPHVAGSVALLLEAMPGLTPAQVRDRLQNTADPKVWQGNPGLGFLDQVHRQGAGMVQIDKAITAPVWISPGKLMQGEAGAALTHTLTLHNTSGAAINYTPSHQAALSTLGTFAPSANTAGAAAGGAITFSPTSITVPAGGTATIDVTIPRPDFGAANKLVYGGYVVFTPSGGGQVLRVPYAGFGGDYQGFGVMTGGGGATCGGTNEVQQVALTGSPTGGTFTLSFTPPGGSTAEATDPIAHNATAANVRTALAALPGIGSTDNVNASGGPLPGAAVNVTFQGALGCRNIPQMTADGTALTGGTSPAATVTTTTQGATPFPKLAKRVGFVSEGSLVPTYTFPETGTITYTLQKSTLFGRTVADVPTVGVHLDHQARWLRMTVLDEAGAPVVSTKSKETLDPLALSADFLPRNSTAGGFFAYGWDGKLMTTKDKNGKSDAKTVPNGTYRLKVEVLKALGTAPADVQTYTSPAFVIARP